MNKLATLTFAGLASAAFAGQPVVSYDKGKQPIPVDEACFAEQELQLDVYGAFTGTYGDDHDDGWGGGLGLNYYFDRNIGIGVDGTVTDGEGDELWQIHGHLLIRFPIDEGDSCWAPYLKLGGGYQVNGEGGWSAGGGAGVKADGPPAVAPVLSSVSARASPSSAKAATTGASATRITRRPRPAFVSSSS
jgi:hypothetical protein